jgi:RNA polymerase sigma-70 factor (ECF subfamily)
MLTYQEAVFRLSYLLLGDPDEADDVAQETFLRAWRHLRNFDPDRPLRPWLLSIASHLASNRRRSAGRYVSALVRAFQNEPVSTDSLEERSMQRMQARDLWKAVRSLSLPDQKIIYLRYFLDLPVAETAQALGVAEGTVKSRLSRALERLRRTMPQDLSVFAGGRER